nr:RloB family protein [uncultured Capnocytophaga sp.]
MIVCEGQTEEWYFSKFPVVSLSIRCVNLRGQSKLNLVGATEEIVRNDEYIFDEVWCVFDMDIRDIDKDFANFDNAIEKAKIWSVC